MVSVANDLADNTVQVGQFNARELYEYTVRDNIELRDRILDFLKVYVVDVVASHAHENFGNCHSVLNNCPVQSFARDTVNCLQDDIFKPNHYLSLMEFRQLTLGRLQKFVAQRYFVTQDYIDGKLAFRTEALL